MQQDPIEILTRIVGKGGLIGSAAKMYLNDKHKAHSFIFECYEHVNIRFAQDLWGKELIEEIKNYCTNVQN